MGRFGRQLLVQIEGWRLSSTGTFTGENLRTNSNPQGELSSIETLTGEIFENQ